jgi:histidinol-phosphate aminotransferase
VPTYRSDLESIPRYIPGKPIDEVVREFGLTSICKLASNECPTEPFPEVVDAITVAASGVNRYPDTMSLDLASDIAALHDLEPATVWVGSGSSDIIRSVASAVGGPGTSAVFASPSFIMYTIVTMISGGEPIAVPTMSDFGHDFDAMLSAVRDDTTIVYVCNPNNPTGNHASGTAVRSFIEALPERVVVIVDEAYAEYATAPDYESLIGEASNRPNVLVCRTFSKVYGLAGMRVGYSVGDPDLIANVRRTQSPFSVTSVGQAAARAALRHQDRVAQRSHDNAVGRQYLLDVLSDRGLAPADSQTNFVYFEPGGDAAAIGNSLLERGVIVRVLGNGVRVSVGTPSENEKFASTLDAVLDAVRGS